jgi:leucyl-tRNA synthetase
VVVPADVADKYGADVLRMCLMFMGPFDATMAWNEKTVVGVRRFLEKLEKFVLEQTKRRSSPHFGLSVVKVAINQAIKSVTNDLENFRYNTAIARLMECLNKLNNEIGYIGDDDFCSLIKMLAPFAPYTAEELWSRVRNDGSSVHVSDWPKYDEKFANEEYTVIPVSVNGKKRDELKVNWQTLGTDEMINMAKELPKIKKWLEGCEMIKVIPVPGRLVNFVVRTK